ncbi:MAG: Cu(I)-responsive transcriptional regulator [Rhizobiaceae bacterium]|nr:Cu(I)-responsive transcriptional regulator [Rhizobiaceae bacterium]
MNIGNAANISGLPTKTIRYYEDIKLVKPARAANGYRDYSDNDTNTLVFLKRARGLGFSIDECRSLLSLYRDTDRASADVKTLAMAKIVQIETRIEELKGLKKTLKNLAENCHGDDRPECPILEDLSKMKS